MWILISAGEASGEHYGAQLMEALKKDHPEWKFFGLGGDEMRAAGCELVVESRDVAVVGLVEVLRHLPRIRQCFGRLVQAARQRHPAAAVLIDFPDFNFRLARNLHRMGIPVIYFVSPQLWAWRSGRINLVRRYVRKMLVIFPFEEEFYRQRGIDADFVGHPLAGEVPPALPRDRFAREHNLNPAKQWIALLPGSRKKEVLLNLPTLLGTAGLLGENYQFLLPVASTLDPQWVRAQMAGAKMAGAQMAGAPPSITLLDDAWQALLLSRAAVVASGTATVQAALSATPFVMVYRVSKLTWLMGRWMVRVPHFAMVNLIAGKRVVPELVQKDFTARNVREQLVELLKDGPARSRMVGELVRVRGMLRISGYAETVTPAERAAGIVTSILGGGGHNLS